MENKLMRASEVAKELDVSLSYAYKLIKQLNEELRKKGYITISGKAKLLTNTLFQIMPFFGTAAQKCLNGIRICGIINLRIKTASTGGFRPLSKPIMI